MVVASVVNVALRAKLMESFGDEECDVRAAAVAHTHTLRSVTAVSFFLKKYRHVTEYFIILMRLMIPWIMLGSEGQRA